MKQHISYLPAIGLFCLLLSSVPANGAEEGANDTIKALNTLMETVKDEQNGFQIVSEYVDSARLKEFFHEQAGQRGDFLAELSRKVEEMGGTPESRKTVTEKIDEGWKDLEGLVSRRDTRAILDEAEKVEGTALKAYGYTLKRDLPEDVRSIIKKQSDAIEESHKKILRLQEPGQLEN